MARLNADKHLKVPRRGGQRQSCWNILPGKKCHGTRGGGGKYGKKNHYLVQVCFKVKKMRVDSRGVTFLWVQDLVEYRKKNTICELIGTRNINMEEVWKKKEQTMRRWLRGI